MKTLVQISMPSGHLKGLIVFDAMPAGAGERGMVLDLRGNGYSVVFAATMPEAIAAGVAYCNEALALAEAGDMK